MSQNKGNVLGLKHKIRSIVPHAFGNHELCGDWFGYKKDPKSFSQKNLPGGKDLVGSGLQTFLTQTLERYPCDDIAQKIEPLGSTQRNERLNGIIASKKLKIRFYGGSESSDYRAAAAIAQFNEGLSYHRQMVTDKLNHRSNLHFLTKYIGKYNVKRHRQAMNQKTIVFKKNRKERRKQRKKKIKRKKEWKEQQSGIGLNNEHTALVQSLLEEKDDPQPKMEQWRKACCLSAPNFVSLAREESVCFIFYDIETGRLGKNADILQFAFAKAAFTEVTPDNPKESQLSFHILPTKRIDASASKVNGLHVSYKIGEKTLVNREGRVLPTVTPAVAAQKIVIYLNSESALNNRQILLVARNGSVFDRPRFIQFLKNNNALDNLLNKEQTYFGDSLPLCRKTFKSYISSRNLCNVYQFLFQETFEAHDALADVLAYK